MPHPAAIVVAIAASIGGTVGLAPGHTDDGSVPPGTDGGSAPEEPVAPSSEPGVPPALGLGAIAAALALLRRREEDLSPSSGLGLAATDPVFVFVPGHGQPEGAVTFAAMVEALGLEEGSVRHFDYRWAGGGPMHSRASRTVGIDDAASALNAYVAGVAADGRDVYLVGFSKGGATVAELIADWDDGRWGPASAVAGAALLDPPMAAGGLGWLQSAGRFIGPIPDDGGYDPVRCRFLGFWCDDRREALGEASGIEVIVIRNPRAAITSFGDVPDGLRVYDADDGGPGPWAQLVRNPLAWPGRIAEAHESVLDDPRVAACIAAEARDKGTCELPARSDPPLLPSLRRPAIRPPSGQSVL